jgi:small-conductance mechanosensitive channel
MLGLPFERLLLGGAVTGVILGIAAQQALSNTFAGVVLLVARPFNPGDHIRIRSGALGGEFDGVVLAMGLTYVTVSTSSGVLSIPNSSMLSSAVGPWTPPPPPAPTVADPPPVTAAKRSVTP